MGELRLKLKLPEHHPDRWERKSDKLSIATGSQLELRPAFHAGIGRIEIKVIEHVLAELRVLLGKRRQTAPRQHTNRIVESLCLIASTSDRFKYSDSFYNRTKHNKFCAEVP